MSSREVKTPYYDFFRIEKEMNLFSLKYKEVHYWQLLRMGLLKKITVKDLHIISADKNRNFKNEIIKTFKEAKRMKKIYLEMPKADIVQIRPCVTVTKDNQLDDHQFDYISLKDRYAVLDLYTLGNYVNVNECVEYDLAQAENELIKWKIKRKLFGASHLPINQRKELEIFLKKINKIYGTNFSIESLLHEAQYAIQCHKVYKKWFQRYLKKISPKLIMEYPHYDEHMFAANAAAKELGIKVIEMQHGRINAHEAYWYEDQSQIGKLLPDYFFTYGEWWNEQINLPEFCKAIPVGNVYLEKQVATYKKEKKDHLVISVFSNPQNGKTLSEFIYSIQDYCLEQNVEILYKLHPNESKVWRTEYPRLSEMKNTKIYDSGSVYDVLSQSDVTIGINSTVFFEALAYEDLQIYIYTIGDYEGMKPLIENKMATAVITPEEFLEKISRKETYKTISDVGKSLWKDNAEDNIYEKLKNII